MKQKILILMIVIFLVLLMVFLMNLSKPIEPPAQPVLVKEDSAKKAKLIILLPGSNEKEIRNTVKEVKRKFGGRIKLAAKRHNYDPKIIIAVIVVESSGNNNAVSNSQAKGLMQLKFLAAKEMGIKDRFHPYDNIWAGTKYLKKLEKRFGSLDAALAAYNIGPTRLDKLLKRGFDPNTYKYVLKIKEVLLYL